MSVVSKSKQQGQRQRQRQRQRLRQSDCKKLKKKEKLDELKCWKVQIKNIKIKIVLWHCVPAPFVSLT